MAENKFTEVIRGKMAVKKISVTELMRRMTVPMSRQTWYKKMGKPELFTLGELYDMCSVIGVNVCELLDGGK